MLQNHAPALNPQTGQLPLCKQSGWAGLSGSTNFVKEADQSKLKFVSGAALGISFFYKYEQRLRHQRGCRKLANTSADCILVKTSSSRMRWSSNMLLRISTLSKYTKQMCHGGPLMMSSIVCWKVENVPGSSAWPCTGRRLCLSSRLFSPCFPQPPPPACSQTSQGC